MKSAIAVLVAAAAAANALSECILTCQTTGASSSGCDTDYNTTACYCDNENFATAVKACLYSSDCQTDVSVFYTARTAQCGEDGASSAETSYNTSSTIADTNGLLGTCILNCQASAASSAACTSSNYNDTSCYCDNEDFATDVKACLYQNCSTEVPIFYNYRSDMCGTSNSSEYLSSVVGGDATDGITATSSVAAATAAATTTGSSAASSTAAAASASSTSTSAAVRDAVFVTGLAAVVAFAMMVVC